MTFVTDVLIWYLCGNERARAPLAGVPFDLITQTFSSVLHISEKVSHRAASFLERYAASHGLEAADALIAATALVNRQNLTTGNATHYRIIRGLDVVVFSPS